MNNHIKILNDIIKNKNITEEQIKSLEETKIFLENIKGIREIDLDNLKIEKIRFKDELINKVIYHNQQLLKNLINTEILINPDLQPTIEITEEMKNFVKDMSVTELFDKLIKKENKQ